MRRFFLSPEKLCLDEPAIEGQDARHIAAVLRLGAGDDLVVFDGTGVEYAARIVSLDNHRVRIRLLERLVSNAESPVEITLAQGYLKDKKMDELVRRLTELGVVRWVPFIARRSVAQPDAKRGLARSERWHKISLEAVKQCRRNRPMAIEPTVSFEQALQLSQSCDLKIFFWETQGEFLSAFASAPLKPKRVFLMVGPEGGFEADEHDAAQRHGFRTVHLGPRILRAETAAVAVSVLAQYLFGDLGQNVLDNP
jgi:16S rRNA (uracil1498-N3)-methyltransferase